MQCSPKTQQIIVSKFTTEFNHPPVIAEQLHWIAPDIALTVRISN